MKTNRIVALLAVLCLITTCFVGTTLAKYVTTGTGTDSARVAKWGVTITTTGDMFGDSYKDTETTWTENEDGDAITVQAVAAGQKVVAPGTNGILAAYDIAGAPEVDTEVTYTADLALTNWEVDGAYYCPIVITVNGEEFDGTAYASAAEFEAAVEAKIVAATQKYDTNEDLSAVEDDLVVEWAWGFSEVADGQTDALDTKLGDAAAAAVAAEDEIKIALTTGIAITQVD